MTIKELHDITDRQTKIWISWDGCIYELNRESILSLEAYGKFIVSKIHAMNENAIEAAIKAIPAII